MLNNYYFDNAISLWEFSFKSEAIKQKIYFPLSITVWVIIWRSLRYLSWGNFKQIKHSI